MEEWKKIPGFPKYEASNTGQIRSLWFRNIHSSFERDEPLILKQHSSHDGYNFVSLSINGVVKSKRVHRLVLAAFVCDCPEGMEGCHNDGNQDNNYLSNLRWDTSKNNHADKKLHKIGKVWQKQLTRG